VSCLVEMKIHVDTILTYHFITW